MTDNQILKKIMTAMSFFVQKPFTTFAWEFAAAWVSSPSRGSFSYYISFRPLIDKNYENSVEEKDGSKAGMTRNFTVKKIC